MLKIELDIQLRYEKEALHTDSVG